MKHQSTSVPCPSPEPLPPLFCRVLQLAVDDLHERLRVRYESALPGRAQLVHRVLVEAKEEAWSTSFPQLFLPDLAEARLADLTPDSLTSRAA